MKNSRLPPSAALIACEGTGARVQLYRDCDSHRDLTCDQQVIRERSKYFFLDFYLPFGSIEALFLASPLLFRVGGSRFVGKRHKRSGLLRRRPRFSRWLPPSISHRLVVIRSKFPVLLARRRQGL